MSSNVSQIEYWQEPSNTTANTPTNTPEGRPNAIFLSYNVFLVLSVLGGVFALDHLYLRSPLTFIAKIVVNILCFGVWWLYDVSQAVFNRDVVKVFGLGVPCLGPKGIAAGVLGSDEPDKKHLNFLFYGLALFLGGMFGADSFIVGDKTSGIIRILCLISIIFAPVALIWWIINLVKFLFTTKNVTNRYWEYFGALQPAHENMTFGQKIVSKIPFLQWIFGIADTAMSIPSKVIEVISEPVAAIIKPVTNTIQTGLETVETALELGKTVIDDGTIIAREGIKAISNTGKGIASAATIIPCVKKISYSLTENTAHKALDTMTGQKALDTMTGQKALNQIVHGGSYTQESGILPYVLIGTIAAIVVSGLVLTYRRSKQNERTRNDSPPEPIILRESNKEESAKTA